MFQAVAGKSLNGAARAPDLAWHRHECNGPRQMAANHAETWRSTAMLSSARCRSMDGANCRHRWQSSWPVPCHHGRVLPDADRSLANWLRRLLPDGTRIRFEAPDIQWSARPPESCFVDLFLHSVRQDSRGYGSGWSDIRDGDGRVVGRRPATQYYRLAYLATAWAKDGAPGQAATEHEILGLLLDGCAYQSILPDDCLEGSLAESGEKTVLECSPADSPGTSGHLWTGLGIAPRAHLELVLVAPVRPPLLTDIALPAREIMLNAAELPRPAEPAEAGAGPHSTERSFGTLRRWEKQTINESR